MVKRLVREHMCIAHGMDNSVLKARERVGGGWVEVGKAGKWVTSVIVSTRNFSKNEHNKIKKNVGFH